MKTDANDISIFVIKKTDRKSMIVDIGKSLAPSAPDADTLLARTKALGFNYSPWLCLSSCLPPVQKF